ncbi:tetraspanin-32 isoform X2 [Harpia harpyja]|uniref:tetraspanin-32 isoform X2 n=1 Tax=Harpia harpyja TaxID=202280 RepID=UPI0022B2094B|nr:tetraspanin-32 isoform X2 [Harpia harpyja]
MGLEFQRAKQRTSSLPKTTTEAGSPRNCTCILCRAGWDCMGVPQEHRSSGFSSHGGIFIHGHWPRDCGLCGVTALMQERKRALLLGLSIATLSTVTHYGLHFTLISNISLESSSYRVIHHTAFYFGICLSMTLILAALLSSAATVRESQCLTAMGFFCFALAFCGLIPAACWRYMHSTESNFQVQPLKTELKSFTERCLCCWSACPSPCGHPLCLSCRLIFPPESQALPAGPLGSMPLRKRGKTKGRNKVLTPGAEGNCHTFSFETRAGVDWDLSSCGRQHDGCVRSCVRGGEEEHLQLQEARADCHPRSIPVLWEALSIWGHDRC